MTSTTLEVTSKRKRGSARERLLETANRLFYAEGIQTVGIDRILEESGVAKASLYTNFGSKDALVGAYLDHRHTGTIARLNAAIDAVDDPREKVLAIFDSQARVFAEPDFHGCAFQGATAEATTPTIDQAAADYRAEIRGIFHTLAKNLGVRYPKQVARQLHLVYDGGIVTASRDHDPSVAADSKVVAAAIIDTAERR